LDELTPSSPPYDGEVQMNVDDNDDDDDDDDYVDTVQHKSSGVSDIILTGDVSARFS
jgi:hypothetical protein